MVSRAGTRIDRGLLIYDGECGFCSRTAAWLRRRMPEGFEIQPSQRIEHLDELGLDRVEVHEAAYWIDPDGRKHRGHLAIIRALEASGGVLGFVSRTGKVWPVEPLASWLYDVVARNRHRLPGASDHCHL